MTTAIFDTLKVSQDLEAAGFNEAQARAIVHSLAGAFEDTVATKADKRADIAAVRADIDKLETSTRAGMAALKADLKTDIARVQSEVFRALWLQGAGLVGIQLAIAGLLFAAIRFLAPVT